MNILIAVDSSGIAEKAFDWYITNMHKVENQVFVCFHAEQPELPMEVFSGGAIFPAEEVANIVAQHKRVCEHMETMYVKKCEAIEGLKFKVIVETSHNNVGFGLVKTAEKYGAELIIMGSRGHGLIRRTILGSNSDFVLHHTSIPVLICHV